MSKVIVILEKYSDWLEAYSTITDFQNYDLHVHFIENERNDKESVEGIFNNIVAKGQKVDYFSYIDRRHILTEGVEDTLNKARGQDIVLAPFIRYFEFWKLIGKLPKSVQKIHLSECLPDTFGHIGYRIGYRGLNIKTLLTLPLAKVFALKNKPDTCYFPLFPKVANPFVKKSMIAKVPRLLSEKQEKLQELTKSEKRPLLIGGFGYDIDKMAEYLGLHRYIATSKGKEIIIDGKVIPLNERLCAEEVLLSGFVSEIVGYTSSAMVWAQLIDSSIKVNCFKSTKLNEMYGSFFSYFSTKALNKLGIEVKEECKEMLE